MLRINVTGLDGEARSIHVDNGVTVMEAIRDNGFEDLLALCGGGCACATCHVYVDEEWLELLPEQSADEDDLLNSSMHRKAVSRLSCQIIAGDRLDGLTVKLAPGE